MTGKTRENLQGVRVVRAFRQEKEEVRGFITAHGALRSLQVKVGAWSQLLNPIVFLLLNVATVVLLYVGAIRVDTAMIT